jgi:fatty acyl-CoA reductase
VLAQLHEKVEVFIHSAASTTFDGRYDALIRTNTLGAHAAALFAKDCKNLQVWIRTSSGFDVIFLLCWIPS